MTTETTPRTDPELDAQFARSDAAGHEQAQADRIRKAKARLEAAKLRILAVSQDDVGGYERTATQHPERADNCLHQAAMRRSFAAQTRAQADLIEAEAGI